MKRSLLAVLMLAVGVWSGCRCPDRLSTVAPPQIETSASVLDFGSIYVGQDRQQTLSIRNTGGSTSLELTLPLPFAIPSPIVLPRGGSEEVLIEFSPRTVGHFEATLDLGSTTVVVLGEGTPLPQCQERECFESHFDLDAGACAEALSAEGSACASKCLAAGRCTAGGLCVGQALSCDDGDACSVDACDGTSGCTHVRRVCPAAASPCQTATCDAVQGCALVDVADGTLCGIDDCLATQTSVCLTGQCQPRPRPSLARCANRWVPDSLPTGAWSGAYDPLRQRVMVVVLGTTWEWDGSRWTQRFPLVAADGLLTWNEAHQRVMASTGQSTWEWDGTTWLAVATGPGPDRLSYLTYDPVRRVAVALVTDANLVVTTWELGATWKQLSAAPPEDGPLAFDPVRGRVVALARSPSLQLTLWSWDGATWTASSTIPTSIYPHRQGAQGLAFDPVRQRIVASLVVNEGAQIVEWDGAAWSTPAGVNPDHVGILTWDGAREALVSFAGYQFPNAIPSGRTWVRRGLQWQKLRDQRPISRAAWNSQRQSFIAIGAAGEPTLEWHGGWNEHAPAPLVSLEGLAYLPTTGQIIGANGDVNDGPLTTYAWDGTSWVTVGTCGAYWGNPFWNPLTLRLTANVGAHNEEWVGNGWSQWTNERFPHPSVFDPTSSTILSVNTQNLVTSSWTVDGGWVERASVSPPNSREAVFDSSRQQVLLISADGFSVISTWAWSGSGWTNVNAAGGPGSSFPLSMGFDPVLQRVMLVSTDGTVWSLLP